MAKITCEYCETEYDGDMPQCPLCGTPNPAPVPAEEIEPRRPKRGGARAAPKEDRIPRWICVLISIFLGLAVIIGSLYALYALDILKFGKKAEEPDETLDLPFEEDAPSDPAPAGTEDEPADTQPDATPGAQAACTALTLDPSTIQLTEPGAQAGVSVSILPANCTEAVVFASSDPAVCSVDATGLITALSEGSATVTAACGSKTATVGVTCDFSGAAASGASINQTDVTLTTAGDHASLSIENAPADAEISWSSSDESVCTVEDGAVTAVGGGTATITAEVSGEKFECVVRCTFEGEAGSGGSGDRLDHTDVTLNVGDGFEISVVDGVSGGWNVTDGSIITVDKLGNVTALASGTAKVYTVVNGKRLECVVRVK